MANILVEKLEAIVSSISLGDYGEKNFFQKIWLPFLLALALQLYCMYISFESEVEYMVNVFIGPQATAAYAKAYILALIFESLKAGVIGFALHNFFRGKGGAVVFPAMLGLALSYGSWWMSDAGTEYQAYSQTGSSPAATSIDAVAGTFDADIRKLDAEERELSEKNFYWCGLHSQAHNCPEAGYYVNSSEKSDRLALLRIDQIKAKRDTLTAKKANAIASAASSDDSRLKDWNRRLTQTHKGLEFKILITEIIVWICSIFIAYVKYEQFLKASPTEAQQGAQSDPPAAQSGTQSVPPGTQSAPLRRSAYRTQRRGVRSPYPPAAQSATPAAQPGTQSVPPTQYSPATMQEAEQALRLLAAQSPELAEELLSLWEREGKKKRKRGLADRFRDIFGGGE